MSLQEEDLAAPPIEALPLSCHCRRVLRAVWLVAGMRYHAEVRCPGCDREPPECRCLPQP